MKNFYADGSGLLSDDHPYLQLQLNPTRYLSKLFWVTVLLKVFIPGTQVQRLVEHMLKHFIAFCLVSHLYLFLV